ncbi:hypothetical protein D3C71_2115430 [compost metagenome]
MDSTSIRIPEAAMIPNSSRDTPPITGLGMDWISAASLPQKDRIMAKIAAPPMTQIE